MYLLEAAPNPNHLNPQVVDKVFYKGIRKYNYQYSKKYLLYINGYNFDIVVQQ